ncbi:uncharacterized protein LOC100375682 [Saccoglossus kowalevskii]|uniref:Uncharacterized protein LOC100375682 n=1 Tax=Saccoglossus kowalevskii TaxID=10224 RepID=A0ABM0GV01_SACKO|nr:PREDICTED: uncharacterized protein LOC100375682 [Saccoglossus kowalevskii]
MESFPLWLRFLALICSAYTVLAYVQVIPSGTQILDSGDSITLSCEATESATMDASFEIDEDWEPQRNARRRRSVDVNPSPAVGHLRRSERATGTTTITSELNSLGPLDTHRWVCKSENKDGEPISVETDTVDIVVVQVDTADSVMVTNGDDSGAAIWCTCAELNPSLCSITWKKDGKLIDSPSGGEIDVDGDDIPDALMSSDTQTLAFMGNKQSDSGVYRCTAEVTVDGISKTMPSVDINVDIRTSIDVPPNTDTDHCDVVNDETDTDGVVLMYFQLPDWEGHKSYSGNLVFSVKAASSVVVRLQYSQSSMNYFEIILGADSNTKSIIHRYIGTSTDTVSAETPRVLDSSTYKTFVISYAYDMITVRKDDETEAFILLTHRDANDFTPAINVKQVEYGTRNRVEGSFTFCHPDPRDNRFYLSPPEEVWGAILTALIGCFAVIIAIILATVTCGKASCSCDCSGDDTTDAAEDSSKLAVGIKSDFLPLSPSYGGRDEKKKRKKHKKHKKQSWSPRDDYSGSYSD